MNFEYQIKIRNLSKKGIQKFQDIENNYESYKMESSDGGMSAIKDSCILDHHEVNQQIIMECDGIREIQAEIYEDLDIELDKEDWDWDDVIYPDPSRIMQSGVYFDFFYDNAVSVFESLQKELEEGWGLANTNANLRHGLL